MKKDAAVVIEPYPLQPLKRISWSAIFVGALVGIGLGFLLNLFGFAIGLSAFTQDSTGANVIAWGGVIGVLIGVIVAMTAAGYAAGYLGRMHCPRRNLGILYGFTTWSVALVLSAVITAHIGNYVTSYSNAIGQTSVSTSDNAATVKVAPAKTATNQNDANVTVSAQTLAMGAFVLFLLFVIGAIFCCLGACWAMTCSRID